MRCRSVIVPIFSKYSSPPTPGCNESLSTTIGFHEYMVATSVCARQSLPLATLKEVPAVSATCDFRGCVACHVRPPRVVCGSTCLRLIHTDDCAGSLAKGPPLLIQMSTSTGSVFVHRVPPPVAANNLPRAGLRRQLPMKELRDRRARLVGNTQRVAARFLNASHQHRGRSNFDNGCWSPREKCSAVARLLFDSWTWPAFGPLRRATEPCFGAVRALRTPRRRSPSLRKQPPSPWMCAPRLRPLVSCALHAKTSRGPCAAVLVVMA